MVDVFTAIENVERLVTRGCIQHKTYYSGICPICTRLLDDAREGIAEIRRTVEIVAADTTAADLRQEIEFLKAEFAPGSGAEQ